MALPALVPFQFPTKDGTISDRDWIQYLETWNDCAQLYLAAPENRFLNEMQNSDCLPEFLRTYLNEQSQRSASPSNYVDEKLRRSCFLLIHRIWLSSYVPSSLKTFQFLTDFCRFYRNISLAPSILDQVWQQTKLDESHDLQEAKRYLTNMLENKATNASDLTAALYRHVALTKTCVFYGRFLMVGSDLLDSLCTAYRRSTPALRSKLGGLTYLSLHSLFYDSEQQKVSLLLDHLYSLRTDYQNGEGSDSLLFHLITATPLLHKLRRLAASSKVGRVKSTLQSLETIGRPPALHRKPKARPDKGQGHAHDALTGPHIHNEASISQIQELFPDLGSGFIARLLDEYSEDVEQVTARLLEDDLPPHLREADRSAVIDHSAPFYQPNETVTPSSVPARRNVFDHDALDTLAVSASQLHIGHRNNDNVLSQAPDKASILSALAAIDPNDDERDDTYDVEDVGGTVDMTNDADDSEAKKHQDSAEEFLYRTWKATPEVFGRDAETRRGPRRNELRNQTAMTDEAIEGWALILARDPVRQKRLERHFAMFNGMQSELKTTRWRDHNDEGEDGEQGEEGMDGMRGGSRGGRGRGRGRGGRGRGRGDVAGPASDKSTQVARQRKDASKGSRANHNRREGRAKKLARAGFAG